MGRDSKVRGRSERQGVFFRVCHSIRTRYSLATAVFLLVVLAMFYVGGRIVLMHVMRDAETQVKNIGLDISSLAYKNAEQAKQATALCASLAVAMQAVGRQPTEIFDAFAEKGLALLVESAADGSLVRGAARIDGQDQTLEESDLAPYRDSIASWISNAERQVEREGSVGLMQVKGAPFYVSLVKIPDGGYAVVGTPFDSHVFSSQVNADFGAAAVRITDRKTAVRPRARTDGGKDRNAFGLSPIISEALNFYSVGFWEFGQSPFEAVFAVRDIAGNAVTMISVSLPKTLTDVIKTALGRMTFFVSVAGILLIIPIFLFQARTLLNPLTKMTEAIQALGARHWAAGCPRLDWKGDDEFAQLAASVNSMLETISARTVELEQLESRQRALIDGMPDMLVVFDRAGRLVSVYKQFEGRQPPPGFVPGSLPSASDYSAEDIATFRERLAVAFRDGVAMTMTSCIGAKGSPDARVFELRLSRMDENFALGVIRDVTEEAVERASRPADETQSEESARRNSMELLAAGIAHDVNNVLSVILNTSEAVFLSSDRAAAAAALESVRDAVRRGSAMTKELMTFADHMKLSLVRTNPSVVVRDVQRLAEGVVAKNVTLSYALADGLPDVDVDQNQFWKVLFNIVKNAGEAIGARPGNVRLQTEAHELTAAETADFISKAPLKPGPGVLFRISDDGPGIKPEFLACMFDPYVSSKAHGRGLGLATVRSIVEAHGGGIRVTSEIGTGTTFHIFLPASALPKRQAPEAAAKRVEEGALPVAAMIVDNEAPILLMGSSLVKSLGVKPYVAHDGQEAQDVLRQHVAEIEVVLLDANLGEKTDSVRLLQQLRAIAPKVRIVISSGADEAALRKTFADHPFDGVLGKPYTVSDLKSILCKK